MNPLQSQYSPVSLEGQSVHERPITSSESIPQQVNLLRKAPNKSVVLIIFLVCFVLSACFLLSFKPVGNEISSRYKYLVCGAVPIDLEVEASLTMLQSSSCDDLYLFVPKADLNSRKRYLYVDQVTKGVGLRALYFDAGHVLAQQQIYFEWRGTRSIAVVAPTPSHRACGGDALAGVCSSFSGTVVGVLDIVSETNNGNKSFIILFSLLSR